MSAVEAIGSVRTAIEWDEELLEQGTILMRRWLRAKGLWEKNGPDNEYTEAQYAMANHLQKMKAIARSFGYEVTYSELIAILQSRCSTPAAAIRPSRSVTFSHPTVPLSPPPRQPIPFPVFMDGR